MEAAAHTSHCVHRTLNIITMRARERERKSENSLIIILYAQNLQTPRTFSVGVEAWGVSGASIESDS